MKIVKASVYNQHFLTRTEYHFDYYRHQARKIQNYYDLYQFLKKFYLHLQKDYLLEFDQIQKIQFKNFTPHSKIDLKYLIDFLSAWKVWEIAQQGLIVVCEAPSCRNITKVGLYDINNFPHIRLNRFCCKSCKYDFVGHTDSQILFQM